MQALQICSLASGSKGNCLYVHGERTAILIDAGLSHKQTVLRLRKRGIEPASIKAVFLTHEHGDHVDGARVWLDRQAGMVYGTNQTMIAAEIRGRPSTSIITTRCNVVFESLKLTTIPTRHNAVEAVTYRVDDLESKKTMVMIFETSNAVTDEMLHHVQEADALLIEANHDPGMVVDNEKLPEFVAQRIIATHLSNAGAARVVETITQTTKLIMLLHLSQENNDPRLAQKVIRTALEKIDRVDVRLVVASQDEPTEVLDI